MFCCFAPPTQAYDMEQACNASQGTSDEGATATSSPAALAATRLNLCAVLGGLGRHEAALGHAEEAAAGLRAPYDALDPRGMHFFTTQSAATSGGAGGGNGTAPLPEDVEAAAAAGAALRHMGGTVAATLASAFYNQVGWGETCECDVVV